MIQYRYAKGTSDVLYDIFLMNESSRRLGAPYFCLGCNGELIPNIPTTKKTKYFSHKINQNCSTETYLHKLAKRVFYENYTAALNENKPFIFTFRQPFNCNFFEQSFAHSCMGAKSTDFDLTTAYKRITCEEKYGDFVPDVTLISEKHEPIFIEIAVSHKASEKKIASGYKIIEIYISNENDIVALNDRHIFESASNITTHNIKGKSKKGNICDGVCKIPADFFVIYRSGKVKMELESPAIMLSKLKHVKMIQAAIPLPNIDRGGFQKLLANLRHFYFQGYEIENCLLCEHQGMDDIKGMKCRVKNMRVVSSDAISCAKYSPYKNMDTAKAGEKRNMDEHIKNSDKLVEKILGRYR